MGLFGGDSQSKTETEIRQSDNKAQSTTSDNGVTRNISGNEKSNIVEVGSGGLSVNSGIGNTINFESFDKNFGMAVIDKTIDAINENLGRSLDYSSATVNKVLSDQSEQLQKISTSPDERIEGLTKLFVFGAIGVGALVIFKDK